MIYLAILYIKYNIFIQNKGISIMIGILNSNPDYATLRSK